MNAEQPPGAADYVLPTISFQSPKLRLKIVISYWLVLALSLPLWWVTTSIERLALPVDRVKATASAKELRFPLGISIKPAAGERLDVDFLRLAGNVEKLLGDERQSDPVAWQGLDVHVNAKDPMNGEPRESTYTVHIHSNLSHSGGSHPSIWITNRSLHISDTSSNNDLSSLSETAASALSSLLVPRPATHNSRTSQKHLVARYANKFRLAFSLLNEDASAGDPVLGWDLEAAIKYQLSSVLSQLGSLHNFTIESQVQFHAPLTFDPPSSPTDNGQYLLGEEELKMFINSADWTLSSSVSNDPVLHFILFVPSASRCPLLVRTPTGKKTDSFVVPQWGSVVILDPSTLEAEREVSQSYGIHLSTTDLVGPFNTFRSQLLALLGVPSLPPSIVVDPYSDSSASRDQLSDWQLDALLRRRALENTRDSKEALSSIVKLVGQIENMPVGQGVKGDVQDALDAIEQVYSSSNNFPQLALEHSARANTLSSRAFFNPGMLALLYFPAEHKYAVYIPLFAPVSVPLVVAMLREISRWRKARKIREKME